MCGIIGVISTQPNARETIMTGLKRLEYRGYDSWGIAVTDGTTIESYKNIGLIPEETTSVPARAIGIGHTRWATHGGVTVNNAHPHLATDGSFALAHNGIVENAQELKKDLVSSGMEFISETDTEVIVRLIEQHFQTSQDILDAIHKTFHMLHGRNTFIVLMANGVIHAVRNGSPLVLGKNEDNSLYLSSDMFSLAPFITELYVPDNGSLITIIDDEFSLSDLKNGKEIPALFEPVTMEIETIDTEGYGSFMLKEIHESPEAIRRITQTPNDVLADFAQKIMNAAHVYTIGSGTSGNAAELAAYYLKTIAGVHATSIIGAESSTLLPIVSQDDVIIVLSQSGETADILEVLEPMRDTNVAIGSLVNMYGSMMSRLSDFPFYTNSGSEISVMSTKVFSAQIAWAYLLASACINTYEEAVPDLLAIAELEEELLQNQSFHKSVQKLARMLKDSTRLFLLGKGEHLPIAHEGMVKISEGAYIHAHALPAGDLKHYAITLIEDNVPVIFSLTDTENVEDTLNAVAQIKARGGYSIGITPHTYADFFDYAIEMPDTHLSIANILPLQLLAYHLAVLRGNNVDKPRNIAKSVTVK